MATKPTMESAISTLFGGAPPKDITAETVRDLLLRQFVRCHALIAWELETSLEIEKRGYLEDDIDQRAATYERADKLTRIATRLGQEGGLELAKTGDPRPQN